ncbi:hypothetical protein ACA351_05575 [Orientia tsutsugamushi]
MISLISTWDRICKKACIKNFRIHDLRRTFASCMGDVGASQMTISSIESY